MTRELVAVVLFAAVAAAAPACVGDEVPKGPSGAGGAGTWGVSGSATGAAGSRSGGSSGDGGAAGDRTAGARGSAPRVPGGTRALAAARGQRTTAARRDARTDGANDVSTSDGPSVFGRCTIGGNECPAGYQCACGGPGPRVCEWHKKRGSAADCSAPDSMCGCSPTDTNKICVSMCFCMCG